MKKLLEETLAYFASMKFGDGTNYEPVPGEHILVLSGALGIVEKLNPSEKSLRQLEVPSYQDWQETCYIVRRLVTRWKPDTKISCQTAFYASVVLAYLLNHPLSQTQTAPQESPPDKAA